MPSALPPDSSAPPFIAGRRAREWGVVTAVYLIATLSLAYPALAGRFLINPRSDQYIAGYAFREFAAQSLRAGDGFPQWNSYLYGGMPYIAAMHGDIFYPTFLLRMLLPTDVAMTWTFIIHLLLAGLFTFGFLRAWGGGGVGFYGALLGGLAYMLSGPIAGYASPGHDGKLFVSALLPLTLWMLVRGVRDGRAWAWGALAITIGLAVLSPHPQLLQYLLLVSGGFALFLALSEHEGKGTLPRNVALRRLGLALGAVILGGVIGAVQYLPLREYVDWSPRAGGAGWQHAVSYSMPIEELLNTVVPEFTGLRDNYWGRNGIHLHSEYPGVAVLLLAGAGMFAARVRRGIRWFWIGVLIISILWALGHYTPFYRIIYEIVPGTKFFRAPSTMMFVTMFSLAILAAFGTERLLQSGEGISKRYLIWPAVLLLVAVLAISGMAISMADAIGEMMASMYQGFDASQMGLAARDNQANVVRGAVRSIAVTLAVVGVLFALHKRRLPPRSGAMLLLALVTIDLWSIERRFWIFSDRARELFRSDAAIDYIKNAAEPGRVIPLDPIGTRLDRAFSGDHMMVHRVRSAIGYHGNELGRYQTLLGQSKKFFRSGGDRQEFWRHENVQYLYTTLPDSLMPMAAAQLGWSGEFKKLVGPVTNFVGNTVYLYRVPGDNPAAWVATAMVKGTDEQALATVLDARFDPARAAIFDTAASITSAALTTTPPPSGVQARVTRLEPGEIDVQLDKPAPAASALVVSENFFPGWRAVVDGRDATTARANYNLIGVPLPAGARGVQLRFSDPAYGTGKVVTWIALLLAIAATAAGLVADRRRTPAS